MTGQELKEIRRTLGWRQVDMAQNQGYSLSYYAAMERGDKAIPPRVAKQFATLHLVYRLAVTQGLIRSPYSLQATKASDR